MKSFSGKGNGQATKGKKAAAKLTIGLDLGDKTSCYCVSDEEGEVIKKGSVATTRKALLEALKTPEPCLIALEVGAHSPWVSRLLTSLARPRFFLRGSGSQVGRYRIKPELREKIDFRRFNLIDPAWDVSAVFDVIFCRNALIYSEHETQNLILRRLIGHLKPRGYLIVGHSEQLHWNDRRPRISRYHNPESSTIKTQHLGIR
jgi:hypothetical protein